jgi:uncharacterized protein
VSISLKINLPEERVAAFCRRRHIRKLALFGSVLRHDFRQDSDVDVLAEFEPGYRYSLFDLLAMQDELGSLLDRRVDLVDLAALRNPFRRHEILRTHQVIYAR